MFRWRLRGDAKLEALRPSLLETAKQPRLRRRPITTEWIGSPATHPSLRGALATKHSRGHNMRGANNPDGRTAAPGLLRFARDDGQGIGSLVSACRLSHSPSPT